jgi:hypothetical protein
MNPSLLPKKSQSASESHPPIATPSFSLPTLNEGTTSSCQSYTQQAHKKFRFNVWDHLKNCLIQRGKKLVKYPVVGVKKSI